MAAIMARWKEGAPLTTTRPPHTAHPRIEGTGVSPKARSGERFKEIPVSEGDLSLLIEPAATDFIAPSAEVLESLTNDAVNLRDATEREEAAKKVALDAKKDRETIRNTIIPVIKENPNLRGLTSESQDVRLTATPTHTEIVFDINKLRDSVRSEKRFRKLTSRRVLIEVAPRKDMHSDVLRAIIEEGLDSLGARVARRASVMTTWLVDDGAVAEMVSSGEITLLPGTRGVEEGFSLKAEHLPKRRKNIKNKKNSTRKGADLEAAPLRSGP